ncbi:hypothetical protein CTZ28_39995 [Streptomyces shenzhenensis]|uniref:Uncharacterized protein n=1 Tax=Streptomyces shenzhenensis TaxID=943815 RepID=A0A3M0HSK5_9ACTN|nr:hypothetical protein CTZ28_39995 [Streptomyces shenzhenensis]
MRDRSAEALLARLDAVGRLPGAGELLFLSYGLLGVAPDERMIAVARRPVARGGLPDRGTLPAAVAWDGCRADKPEAAPCGPGRPRAPGPRAQADGRIAEQRRRAGADRLLLALPMFTAAGRRGARDAGCRC